MDLQLRPAPLCDCDAADSFLQSGFWASFKSGFGWSPRSFLMESDALGGGKALLVMEKGLKAGLSFAYLPHGPERAMDPSNSREALAERGRWMNEVCQSLREHLSPSVVFLRVDPPSFLVESPKEGAEGSAEGGAKGGAEDSKGRGGEGSSPLAAREPERPLFLPPLRRAIADVQPPDTVLLELGEDETLLQAMKPKWRYNIRLAEKKGVVVSEVRAGDPWAEPLSVFYRLYRETSERDRIALHPERYYRGLFELASRYSSPTGKRPDLRLWTASHEGEALASIVTLFWGKQAVYLYGASSNEKRNLMPAYALQWAAIRAAREAACSSYDFYGIPPSDDPNHPMAGLYRFKTGFGGRVVHRGGSWDLGLRPGLYSAFRGAEALRTWYYKDFRKKRGS